MPKSTSHIRRHLRASKPVAALLDEIERRERLLSQVCRLLPAATAGHCRQAVLRAGVLTLFVDSPVWVDRFRFLCDDLIAGLVADGVETQTCRVRVLPFRPSTLSTSPSVASGPQLDPDDGVAQATLPPETGPSALSSALARLARTLARTQGH